MDLKLTGRTALVTGASSQGIGRAIAKGLAEEGVKLCISARRRDLLEQLAQEIGAGGGLTPLIAVVDLVQEGAAEKLAREALEGLGKIDILINSAGAGAGKFTIETPGEKWDDAMTLLYTRVRQLTQAVLPGMIKNKWGRIINLTGVSEPEGLHQHGSTPAKAALHGYAKSLSNEVGRYGVTVNSIAPARIMTEQIRQKYPEQVRKEFSERNIPLGRFGEPEEIANLAVFLASPRANYITGSVMPVDGGLRRFAF